jgi:hypothetical protein
MSAAARPAFSRGVKALSALGVFAAVVVAVNANVLVARWYERWDVTSEGLFSLSEASKRTLAALPEGVEVVVLLTRGDPLLPRVRQLLAAYGAETDKLVIRYVDPERSPAEFVAIQQKYQILAGKADDGRVVTDAVIVIAHGEKTWFITGDDVTSFDDEGRARPELEQALTEGLANVQRGDRGVLCAGEGHGEASIDDAGPEGLAELRQGLTKNNFEVRALNLELPDAAKKLAECQSFVIAGPEVAHSFQAAERLKAFLAQGGRLLAFVSPVFGADGEIVASGLEPVAALAGAELGRDLVLETDPSARLPRGAGEVFFAAPKLHDVTRGLVQEDKVEFRVLVSQAQSLRTRADASAKSLLLSSDQALSVRDVRSLLDGNGTPSDGERGQRTLAVAAELGQGARVVWAGAKNLPQNKSFRDPALLGDRLFVENAVSWASSRPALVSVPKKSAQELGLTLTEESLSEVLRYVLVYMPAVSALLGILVLFERRQREKRGRARARKGAA